MSTNTITPDIQAKYLVARAWLLRSAPPDHPIQLWPNVLIGDPVNSWKTFRKQIDRPNSKWYPRLVTDLIRLYEVCHAAEPAPGSPRDEGFPAEPGAATAKMDEEPSRIAPKLQRQYQEAKAWFLQSTPPAAPFQLWPWEHISDPKGAWAFFKRQIDRPLPRIHPNLETDLIRLYELCGPGSKAAQGLGANDEEFIG